MSIHNHKCSLNHLTNLKSDPKIKKMLSTNISPQTQTLANWHAVLNLNLSNQVFMATRSTTSRIAPSSHPQWLFLSQQIMTTVPWLTSTILKVLLASSCSPIIVRNSQFRCCRRAQIHRKLPWKLKRLPFRCFKNNHKRQKGIMNLW